ncbi:MAG: DNA polymerase [Clostridium sp.]
MQSRYHIIQTEKEVDRLIEACSDTKYACFDYETNARPIYCNDFYPTILSVSFQVGSGISLPLNHFDSPFTKPQWLRLLRKFGSKVISNPEITKVAWNWKFDQQINDLYGIYNKGRVLDGMLAKYLLDEEKPNGLKEMVERYLPEFGGYQLENNLDKMPWDKKPLEPLSKYGCMDTDCTLRLTLFFEKKLIELGLYPLYRNLIMMASRVLLSVEKTGLPFDVELNKELKIKYGNQIEKFTSDLRSIKRVKKYEKYTIENRKEAYLNSLEEQIDQLRSEGKDRQIKTREQKISRLLAGEFTTKDEKKIIEPLNFGSTKQMVDLLYNSPKGLNLPIIEYTKDKHNKPTKNPSTAEDTLVRLKEHDKHGFINSLLDLRGIQTINSTFIVGMGELVQSDNRVHPSFLIHGTTSGRLSSRNPNGQNIPKTSVNPDVKKQFIAPDGELFFAYDYSQAELRILAHLAKEKTMLEWFRTGKDIHLASACKKYNEDYEEILKIYEDELHPRYPEWKVKRKQAKTINFGIVYEQSAAKLAEGLTTPDHTVTKEEAQTFLDDYFKTFPRIKKFMDTQHKFMEKNGYCVSLFGRKRRCPKVYSESYREYLEALRQSTNMPCQSAASDMALFASILVWEEVKLGRLPPMKECTTVHDSVYQFIKPSYITPHVVYKIWDICRNPSTKEYFGFSIDDVDMSMDFSIGRVMAEELPYIPGYDYNRLLAAPKYGTEEYKEFKKEYFGEHAKTRDISIKDYPKKFKQYFKEERMVWKQQ